MHPVIKDTDMVIYWKVLYINKGYSYTMYNVTVVYYRLITSNQVEYDERIMALFRIYQ